MTARERTVTVEQTVSVYCCDRCGAEIGEGKLVDGDHYNLSVSQRGGVPRTANIRFFDLCVTCSDALRGWLTS